LKKLLGVIIVVLSLGLYLSPDLRNLATKFMVYGTIDNAGKVFRAVGDILKNVQVATSMAKADSTLESLNKVNKLVVVEGSITSQVKVEQYCKVLFGLGSEINIYEALDSYNIKLFIDFSKIRDKNGTKYVVPLDAIKWVITVPVKVQPFSKVNDKYFEMPKTLPLFITVQMMVKYRSLFNSVYRSASNVQLVGNAEVIELSLPPLDDVKIEMEDGFEAKIADARPTYSDFVYMYYPGDTTYKEEFSFNLAPMLQAKQILTNNQ
jgi:hypothetical protein